MATELGQAYVQIMPSSKGISGSISKTLSGEATSAGKSAGLNIVGALKGIIVTAGIGKAIAATITEGGALQQSIGGIETLFKDNADTVRKYANKAYKTVGVSANEYMENVTSFSASLLQSMGGDTKKSAEVANMAMVDMGDNANKMGTDMRDIQNAYQGFAKSNYTMLDNLKLGYGGTKGEMERLLADATALSGVEYNIDNLADVYSAINVIQEGLGITGTTALEAEETMTGSLNAMKSAFTDVMGNLAIGENLGPSLSALSETVSTFLFDNFFPMVGDILSQLPGAIATFVQEFIPDIIESGGGLITSLATGITEGVPLFLESISSIMDNMLTWIAEQLPTILDEGVAFISEFANGLFEGMPGVLDNMGEIIGKVLEAILDAAPKILDGGMDLVTNLAKGIWDNLPAVVESMINILGNLLDIIIEKYPEYLKKGVEIIGKMAKGIWDNLPEIITTLGNLLMKLIQAIRERMPEFLQKGFELIGQLAWGLIKAIPSVVAKIPAIIAAIVKAIIGLGGELVGAGKDLMLGLAKGIGDSVGAVVTKAKEAAGKVVDSVKGYFGINSPSRVFMGIGEYVNLGLAKGIEDNISPVTRAMQSMSDQTISAFSAPNLAIGGMGYSSSSQFNNSYGNIDRLISMVEGLVNRDVVVALNGKEIVRQTVGDMSVELNNRYNSTSRGRGVK